MTALVPALACLVGLVVGCLIGRHDGEDVIDSTQRLWQQEARERKNAQAKLEAAVDEADLIMRQCQNCHDDWLRTVDRLDIGDVMGGSDTERGA